MLQARQLGKELFVGVHSDEEILLNKGPVVMKLAERITAVDACKWLTQSVPGAPYVTDPKVMDDYGCKYVVHGDDITTDANGEDCYQVVKDLGKFVVVKRTPNISTTDLVGRMLLMSTSHHYNPIDKHFKALHPLCKDQEKIDKFAAYASDELGLKKNSAVYAYAGDELITLVEPSETKLKQYQSIVYIDGGFDLFNPGHIEALKIVKEKAGTSAVIVGLHDDAALNQNKGLNYPIMNLFERSLCVLQCRYVDGVVLGAPYIPNMEFLNKLPGKVNAVFHGPTPINNKVYNEVESIFQEIGPHKFDDMNTKFIVDRVLQNKEAYEERQRRKGWKAEHESKLEAVEKSNH